MLMRFDPFRELDRLTQELWGGTRQLSMPLDAYRRDDRVIVHFDLPGVEPASIDVTLDRDVLTVSAERAWQPEEGDHVLVNERRHGRVSRQLFLGDGLDGERIEARYENGVLVVTLPVAEQAKPRKVEVTSGAPALDTTSVESTSSVAA